MKTLRQPVAQTRLCAAQVDTGHTDLGESTHMRPPPQLLHKPHAVDVMTLLHPQILETRTLHWPDEATCAEFAARLATHDQLRNAFITLHGELGTGKTTFVRHLLRALGVEGRVKSPTYAVLESYALPGFDISHFDFYRFDDVREWEDAGFREVFAHAGLKLAEWPDKAALPVPDLRVHLQHRGGDARAVELSAYTPRGVALLA
jgi:tRNA threonylcarbamoyladenosine biosynthesis protein TsaE